MRQVTGPDGGRPITKPKIGNDIDVLTLDMCLNRGFIVIFDALAIFGQRNTTN